MNRMAGAMALEAPFAQQSKVNICQAVKDTGAASDSAPYIALYSFATPGDYVPGNA